MQRQTMPYLPVIEGIAMGLGYVGMACKCDILDDNYLCDTLTLLDLQVSARRSLTILPPSRMIIVPLCCLWSFHKWQDYEWNKHRHAFASINKLLHFQRPQQGHGVLFARGKQYTVPCDFTVPMLWLLTVADSRTQGVPHASSLSPNVSTVL